ncbi:MAG: hypothetical protein WC263_01550 [Candidatus Micrarchaeia archaeon]|jgi:hypothetical protein
MRNEFKCGSASVVWAKKPQAAFSAAQWAHAMRIPLPYSPSANGRIFASAAAFGRPRPFFGSPKKRAAKIARQNAPGILAEARMLDCAKMEKRFPCLNACPLAPHFP